LVKEKPQTQRCTEESVVVSTSVPLCLCGFSSFMRFMDTGKYSQANRNNPRTSYLTDSPDSDLHIESKRLMKTPGQLVHTLCATWKTSAKTLICLAFPLTPI
jgi:hypothetical protein